MKGYVKVDPKDVQSALDNFRAIIEEYNTLKRKCVEDSKVKTIPYFWFFKRSVYSVVSEILNCKTLSDFYPELKGGKFEDIHYWKNYYWNLSSLFNAGRELTVDQYFAMFINKYKDKAVS